MSRATPTHNVDLGFEQRSVGNVWVEFLLST